MAPVLVKVNLQINTDMDARTHHFAKLFVRQCNKHRFLKNLNTTPEIPWPTRVFNI